MSPQDARVFYQQFLEKLRSHYPGPDKIQDGVFGAMMKVQLVNDGPVTYIFDTKDKSKFV